MVSHNTIFVLAEDYYRHQVPVLPVKGPLIDLRYVICNSLMAEKNRSQCQAYVRQSCSFTNGPQHIFRMGHFYTTVRKLCDRNFNMTTNDIIHIAVTVGTIQLICDVIAYYSTFNTDLYHRHVSAFERATKAYQKIQNENPHPSDNTTTGTKETDIIDVGE
jgi:hypothetical protein